MSEKTIGILALQGDFAKHAAILEMLKVPYLCVRTPEDLKKCHGLIMPGGESTSIYRQLAFIKLIEPLSLFARSHPIFGTCAGLILMSHKIIDEGFVKPFGFMDIAVERNAFGRQAESFLMECEVTLPEADAFKTSAAFIRAPRIRQWDKEVKVLANIAGEPILVEQGRHLAATFHPELTKEVRIHQYFISKC